MAFMHAQLAASSRPLSEDRLAVHAIRGGLVVVVADGAGGISGGGAAADRVLAIIERHLRASGVSPFTSATWAELLAAADLEFEDDHGCGETTAVVVAVSESGIVGASVGDSEAWLVREDGHEALTAGQHRKRRLGSGRALPVRFERPPLDGTLLAATDGLFGYARPDALCRLALGKDLDGAAQALVRLARLPSGDLADDLGLVLIRRG